MQAANAPTPGTTRPSALSASAEVGGDFGVRPGPLQGPLGGTMLPDP